MWNGTKSTEGSGGSESPKRWEKPANPERISWTVILATSRRSCNFEEIVWEVMVAMFMRCEKSSHFTPFASRNNDNLNNASKKLFPGTRGSAVKKLASKCCTDNVHKPAEVCKQTRKRDRPRREFRRATARTDKRQPRGTETALSC